MATRQVTHAPRFLKATVGDIETELVMITGDKILSLRIWEDGSYWIENDKIEAKYSDPRYQPCPRAEFTKALHKIANELMITAHN